MKFPEDRQGARPIHAGYAKDKLTAISNVITGRRARVFVRGSARSVVQAEIGASTEALKLTLGLSASATQPEHRRSRFAVLHNIITLRKVYSTTSSAATSSVCGIVRPSSFAVLRLMTNSNFVGCSTGRSLGLAPRKILSTYSAARWNRVGMLGP